MDRRKFIISSAAAVGTLSTGMLFGSRTQAADKSVLNLIVQPEPPTLIPALNQQGPTLFVSGKIYQSLLTYSFDLEPQPSLAKSWEFSDDGLTLIFYLQEGVKWHDGKPFTADDVVFSLGDMLPEVHARARVILNDHVKAVEKLDELTVQITLQAPFPAIISVFEPGFAPMMPRHIYAGTDYKSNPANSEPVGTGPFMFRDWKRGSYIRLEKNPDYWKPDLPHLDELIFNVIPDSESRAVAFENGRVDALRGGDVDYVDVNRLRSTPNISYTTKGWELYSPQAYLIPNIRTAPFDNVKVRQALMYALDREMIVNNIFFGFGKVANGSFVRTERFYDPDLATYNLNEEKAKELIKESGIKPQEHTINQLSLPYGSAWNRLDEYLRQVLKQLGFNVNLESTDAGGWASRTGSWDFDITPCFAYQYGDPALGVGRFYKADNIVKGSPFANAEGYNNPKLDELWDAAATEINPDKRQSIYSEIQNKIIDDVPLIWLHDMTFPTLYRSNIKNLVTTAIGLNESFDNVYFE